MKTVKAPRVVTIKRSKWLRGASEAFLRNPDTGKMCCLGFLARKVGLSTRQINDKREPEDLTQCITGLTKILNDFVSEVPFLENTNICVDLMSTNDDTTIDDKIREKQIKDLGKGIGVTFKFVE